MTQAELLDSSEAPAVVEAQDEVENGDQVGDCISSSYLKLSIFTPH